MVEVLLSKESGITSEEVDECESFVTKFVDELEEDERRMWNTPLMVAMLVASWQEKQREDQEKATDSPKTRIVKRGRSNPALPNPQASPPSEPPRRFSRANTMPSEHKVDITNIYNVALDFLLRRFQTGRQAD